MRTAFLIHGTNKYLKLAADLANNLSKLKSDVIVFTNVPVIEMNGPIKVAPIDHLPWPLTTLLRYHRFYKYRWLLNNYDYVYHIDADVKLNRSFDIKELVNMGELVFTSHPSYYTDKVAEFNTKGVSALNVNEKDIYYWGTFFGGKTNRFLDMCEQIIKMIDTDLKNNTIPDWWDEAYLNFFVNRLAINHNILNPQDWVWPENINHSDSSKFIAINKDENIRNC